MAAWAWCTYVHWPIATYYTCYLSLYVVVICCRSYAYHMSMQRSYVQRRCMCACVCLSIIYRGCGGGYYSSAVRVRVHVVNAWCSTVLTAYAYGSVVVVTTLLLWHWNYYRIVVHIRITHDTHTTHSTGTYANTYYNMTFKNMFRRWLPSKDVRLTGTELVTPWMDHEYHIMKKEY